MKFHKRGRRVVAAVSALAIGLSGCASLPSSGPNGAGIVASASASLDQLDHVTFSYALVDLSEDVLGVLKDSGRSSIRSTLGGGRGPAPEILVGVGDRVQVAVFEAASGGLFIPADAGSRPGNFITLPAQTVDRSGTISVPYAGLVPAAGRSLPQIQADIEMRLANRAIEPQAVVSVLDQRAAEVSVLGDVNASNRLTVNAAGDRILDVISRAGGLRFPGSETQVTLQRGGGTATINFDRLIQSPEENIFVVPGDTIYVKREEQVFLAFGASGNSGEFKFGSDGVTLAEAVAKVGGLQDNRADPAQTFIYRVSPRKTLERMGVDLAAFPRTQTQIPTIFRANMRDPSAFFMARNFTMNDKDVLYVANADSVELIKFLSIVNSISSTVRGVASDSVVTRDSVRALRN